MTHDTENLRKRVANQRRELRRLNRALKMLRGLYREAARSSLETTCVELGRARDTAWKERDVARSERDKLLKRLYGDGSTGAVFEGFGRNSEGQIFIFNESVDEADSGERLEQARRIGRELDALTDWVRRLCG